MFVLCLFVCLLPISVYKAAGLEIQRSSNFELGDPNLTCPCIAFLLKA